MGQLQSVVVTDRTQIFKALGKLGVKLSSKANPPSRAPAFSVSDQELVRRAAPPYAKLDFSTPLSDIGERVRPMAGTHSLQQIVRFGLERAQRLVRKIHPDPIDPQFRIATPEGDCWIAMTLTEKSKRMDLVSDFMAWKLSPGFVMASELREPDAIMSIGLMRDEYWALISVIQRNPLSFGAPKSILRENMDPEIFKLQARGGRTITSARMKELELWFGARGKFPAVRIATGEMGL
jgi:hypothetical protein